MSEAVSQREQALSSYRVLDLTDEKGYLCGRILGDLGADVIKIEPPQGDPGRNIGPFYKDMSDPEKSLLWFSYNYNKRGITLDLTKGAGKEILKKLVKNADFLIESFPPGYLDGLGLGYEDLCEINERLVFTSITPFGQSGPYRDYKGPDLIGMALGGYLYLTGD
ncbi:MAG: CoA transferase, partial [Dehalococcoidia bacterium]